MYAAPFSARPLSLLAVLALLLAASASADPAPAPAAADAPKARYAGFDGTPCEKDYNDHCSKNVGVRGAYECVRLVAEQGVGSPECLAHTEEIKKAKLAKALEAQKRWQNACKGDIAKLCAEFADGAPKTVKGCLGRKRAELSAACNEELPIRGSYSGPGDARWKDGSEPEGWDLEREMKNRPRKMAEKQAAKAAEEERAQKRAEIMAEHARRKAAREAAAAQAAGGAAQTSPSDAPAPKSE